MQETRIPVSPLSEARERMVEQGRAKHLCKTLMEGAVGLRRKVFDPASFEDRLHYARFLEQGRWVDGRSFECEAPYMSVPETVREKLLAHFLRRELDLARAQTRPASAAPAGNVVSMRRERSAEEIAREIEESEAIELADELAPSRSEVA